MKNGIRILGVGLILILASSCCLAAQGAALEKGIDVKKYMAVQTEQTLERFEISTAKFAEMRQEAKAREISDLALSREIIRQAGLLQGEETISHKLALEIARAKNITFAVQYLKIANNGAPETLRKAVCSAEVKREKQQQKDSWFQKAYAIVPQAQREITPFGGGGNITSENGYMQLVLLAVEQQQKGYFQIVGLCTWLKEPLTRKVDAISLAIDDFTWDGINESDGVDSFSSSFQYTQLWADNIAMNNPSSSTHTQAQHEKSAKQGLTGFYYEWDLPNNSHSVQGSYEYEDMIIMIYGRGRLKYYNSSQTFRVFLKYAHLQWAISNSLSFGWSSGGLPGVTIETSLESKRQYYSHGIPVDYLS